MAEQNQICWTVCVWVGFIACTLKMTLNPTQDDTLCTELCGDFTLIPSWCYLALSGLFQPEIVCYHMMYCQPLITFSHLPNVWLTHRLSFFLTARQQILNKSFYWFTCRQVFLIQIVSIWPCFTSCLCSEASSHTSPSLPESTASAGVLYRGATALAGRNAQSAPDRDSGERGSRGGAGDAGPWALSARRAGEVQPVHRRPGEGGEPAAVPVCSAGEGSERPEHRGPAHRCWGEGEEWKSCLFFFLSFCFFLPVCLLRNSLQFPLYRWFTQIATTSLLADIFLVGCGRPTDWYHEIHWWPWLMLDFTFMCHHMS